MITHPFAPGIHVLDGNLEGRDARLAEVQKVANWYLAHRPELRAVILRRHETMDDALQEVALKFLASRAEERIGKKNQLSTLATKTTLWTAVRGLSKGEERRRDRERHQLSDGIDHAHGSTDRDLDAVDDADELAHLMAGLNERERVVIERHVLGGEMLHDVGKDMGICRERVRQLGENALKKMRAKAAGIVPGFYDGRLFPPGCTVRVTIYGEAWKRRPGNGIHTAGLELLMDNPFWIAEFIRDGDWWKVREPENQRLLSASCSPEAESAETV